jgi:hypothetical protein
MNNWRSDRIVGDNQIGFWGACSFLSVSVKDRSLLVPLVILNACLIFSWSNKVSFDHELVALFGLGSRWGRVLGLKGVWQGHEE